MLPLPYCQLLKMFAMMFIYTLPWVVANDLHWWTPLVRRHTFVALRSHSRTIRVFSYILTSQC